MLKLSKDKINRLIEEFNRRFGTKCRLIKILNDEIIVSFEGHECFTCGTYDYFEDLTYFLSENLNIEYGVEKYIQKEDYTYLVYLKPKNKIKKTKKYFKLEIYY